MVNEASISLWFDNWCDKDSISSRLPSIQFSPRDRVSDIIHDYSWSFTSLLPPNIRDFLLQSTRDILLMEDHRVDSISWKDSTIEILSIKASWDLLRNRATSPPWIGFSSCLLCLASSTQENSNRFAGQNQRLQHGI